MVTYYVVAFIAYFMVLIAIGIISHQRQTTNSEFIVGNRQLNFWVTALSAHASDMSAWLFMGLPVAVYLTGMSGSWIAIGLMLGMFLNWKLVASKLRTATENTQSYTLSSYFESRFSDTSGIIRVLTACMLLFFLSHYLSAALTAMGLLIESLFGINYYIGLTFATLVVVAYTFGGGFVTIAWTDFFQALLLLFSILIVPILALFSLENGWENLREIGEQNPGYLNLLGDKSPESILNAVILSLSWGLGYFGMPHVITKFMGIRDVKEMNKSMYVGMTWQFFALSSAIAVGIIGTAFFADDLADPQLVFVDMVKSMMHPFFAGFILCGVIAANLSTMDSQMLVCASALGEDLYKRFFGKNASQLHLVRVSRIGVIIIAFIALLIAYFKDQAIIDSVMYAWAGLGSSFGPLVLTSLYYKNANRYGAIAGILVGGGIALAWPWLNPYLTATILPAMIPGFFLSLLSIFIVSNLTRKYK